MKFFAGFVAGFACGFGLLAYGLTAAAKAGRITVTEVEAKP